MNKATSDRIILTIDVLIISLFTGLALWGALGPEPAIDLARTLQTSSWTNPLGTDALGRDLLSRLGGVIINAVLPVWAAAAFGSLVGWFMAALAVLPISRAASGISIVVGFIMLIVAAVPAGLLAFFGAVLAEQAGIGPILAAIAIVMMALAFVHLRNLHHESAQLGHWVAFSALGGGDRERLVNYGVFGDWQSSITDRLFFSLRAGIVIEASVSWLGYGIQEPAASFGNMIAAHFDQWLRGNFHVLIVIVAGLALVTLLPTSLVRACRTLLRNAEFLDRKTKI